MGFLCINCGYISPKWMGRCPSCGEWNTLVEEKTERKEKKFTKPVPLKSTKLPEETKIKTGLEEFDRVLGGGIVKGGYYLLGGEPGIGKSTLLLQVANIFSKKGYKVLYVSGEESPSQIKIRAERINIDDKNIFILCENNIEGIKEGVKEVRPELLIIDSIQTVYSPEFASSPGSITQVRECGAEIMRITKENEISSFVIGHVTKMGEIAGPKTLEHMVDCVLYLEGEEKGEVRILRSVKNRFGSAGEIGVFEITSKGLIEIKEIENIFLHRDTNVPGSAVVSLAQGTRPLFVEVQSLVTKTPFSIPKRETSGFDIRRLSLLIALMEKRLSIPFYKYDVYLNVTGGIKIYETSCDLGVCVSLISSMKNISIPKDILFIGEVGLGGEIRPVNLLEMRLKEAERIGFKKAFIPFQDTSIKNIKVVKLKNLEEMTEVFK